MQHDRKHHLNPADPARQPALQHDRRHDLNARVAGEAEDHDGERNVSLSAKSLAARGDALDGSEDGTQAEEEDGEP